MRELSSLGSRLDCVSSVLTGSVVGEGLQTRPMTRGMQNHVLVLKSLKMWIAVTEAKIITPIMAAASEGS